MASQCVLIVVLIVLTSIHGTLSYNCPLGSVHVVGLIWPAYWFVAWCAAGRRTGFRETAGRGPDEVAVRLNYPATCGPNA